MKKNGEMLKNGLKSMLYTDVYYYKLLKSFYNYLKKLLNMEAKEIMIGDYVRLVKEYGNPQDEIIIVDALDLYRISQGDYKVEPIILTSEILEKNGFEHKTDIVWHDIYVLRYRIELANKELEQDQTLMLAKDPYNVFYWIPEMSAVSALNFKYVHELQHVLRLCKIDKEIII